MPNLYPELIGGPLKIKLYLEGKIVLPTISSMMLVLPIHVFDTISSYQRISTLFHADLSLKWLIPIAAGVGIGMIVLLF